MVSLHPLNSPITTKRLRLVLESPAEVWERIERLSEPEKKEISPAWIEKLRSAPDSNPWIHGYRIEKGDGGPAPVGGIGFKGPPVEGVVEIAYWVAPEFQGQGFATEAAAALTGLAVSSPVVNTVRAHTLPQPNASSRVLLKCGFRFIGEVIDPEDGPVWRWEKAG